MTGRADRALLLLAALALLATFLSPQWPVQRALPDQVVVLDITQSMNVADQHLDGQPVSRLDFAKHQLRQALLQLPCGARVGWGVFTEYRAFLLFAPVEVCGHLQELRASLDHIDGRMAWAGNSEVAKGLFSSLGIAAQLPGPPALVFVTDGHEAPPLHPRHRPSYQGKPGEVAGLLLGVGGLVPQPIPKRDLDGRPLGVWRAEDVMQTDPRSQGRGGSVGGERLVEDPGQAAPALPGLAAATGQEHLSALREAYLRLLASETGLAYVRLDGVPALAAALTAPGMAHLVPVQADLRMPLALLALGLLLLRQLGSPGAAVALLAIGTAAAGRAATPPGLRGSAPLRTPLLRRSGYQRRSGPLCVQARTCQVPTARRPHASPPNPNLKSRNPTMLSIRTLLLPLLATASLAATAGPQCTTEPQSKWLTAEQMTKRFTELGYIDDVKKLHVSKGNCWEIYGHEVKTGKQVEIYFHPITAAIMELNVRK